MNLLGVRMSSPSRNLEVESFLQAAADYALMGAKAAVCGLDEERGQPNKLFYQYARLISALEIHFLFPNLNERERDLLVDAVQTRHAVRLREGRQGQPATASLRARKTRTLQSLKRRLAVLRRRIRNKSWLASLTPLQRRILKRRILDPSA